jgi:hypothetical protein
VPVPPKNLPPGQDAFDGGFDMGIDVFNPYLGHGLMDVPFIIKSGFPTSLISQSLAQNLGLDLNNLPTMQALGDFGSITVWSANLQVRLFNDPSFATFSVPVGITDPSINPFGDNLLASDILGLLPYWEISEDAGGVNRFYAASKLEAIPEPSTAWLASAGIACLLAQLRRSKKNV